MNPHNEGQSPQRRRVKRSHLEINSAPKINMNQAYVNYVPYFRDILIVCCEKKQLAPFLDCAAQCVTDPSEGAAECDQIEYLAHVLKFLHGTRDTSWPKEIARAPFPSHAPKFGTNHHSSHLRLLLSIGWISRYTGGAPRRRRRSVSKLQDAWVAATPALCRFRYLRGPSCLCRLVQLMQPKKITPKCDQSDLFFSLANFWAVFALDYRLLGC